MVRDVGLFAEAKKLRQEGKSYSAIRQRLNLSKSTLSEWFSQKKWSQGVTASLNNSYRSKNTKRLIHFNKRKHFVAQARYAAYRKEAQQEYSKMRENRLFLAGLSLYWGEGEKAANGRVSVINTDAYLLQVVVRFYRKVLKVPEEKLRAAIFVYSDIAIDSALTYWSRKIKISSERFVKTQVLPSRSRITKKKIEHGICTVYFSNTQVHTKMLEWIRLFGNDMRV
ncbi:hypothetical protein HY086_03205 [Candidatus Gottesmanbacteria bacterium]|nr:hypothetical protein [Candidatus Gottesmanbacteria bacterium]